jgi:hypothetical protein
MSQELAYDLNSPDIYNPTTGEVAPNKLDPEFEKAFEFPGKLEPGVYFGMSEEQYHAIPCMSASGVKHLLTSSMDFWARSWLNQWRDDDKSEEDSEAKDTGKAYHVRLLEGKEKFYATYAPAFICDNPDALETKEDMKAGLAKVGIKDGLSKYDRAGLIDLLKKADPNAVILDDLKAAHMAEHPGKQFISWKLIRKMELAVAMIENHPELKFYFRGGYPEVTIIFYAYGLLFKARIDYLKVKASNDLKTFANQMAKRIERAIYSDVTNNKYFIPGSLYLLGCDAAKEHIREGRVFGTAPPAEWLTAFTNSEPHDMNFVFQQKGIAPVTRAALYSRKDAMFDVALDNIRFAAEQFKEYWRVYQADPWIDREPAITLTFSDYPSYAGQI